MRIGVTGGPREWPVAASLGYDYVEGNFSWIASLDQDGFEAARQTLAGTGLKAETFNGFFGAVRLYETTDEWMREYTKRAFERCALLGGEIAVLGAGGARRVPDDFPVEKAKEKFARVLSICGDEAQKVGMRVVIEPLRRAECNFINTVTDSMEMVRMVGHPAVGTLVDFFHFYSNGETPDELTDAAPSLWHAHLARPQPDRDAPRPADLPSITPYAEALRAIGYKGRISLECSWKPDYQTAITEAFPVMDVFRNV
ncbi:MAG: sugar phosphate isomerase/epimerase [Clostridia bacterium]|nr:sugar phosphate isomerase/epimerase [Clostridia bacterium]